MSNYRNSEHQSELHDIFYTRDTLFYMKNFGNEITVRSTNVKIIDFERMQLIKHLKHMCTIGCLRTSMHY